MNRRANQIILVFRVGQLGDALVSVLAVELIRRAHPQAALVLLTDQHPGAGFVSPWEVFRPTGWFVGVLYYVPREGLSGVLRLIREIRALAPRRLYCLRAERRRGAAIIRDEIFFRLLCGIPETPGLLAPTASRVLGGDPKFPDVERESDRLLRFVGRSVGEAAPQPKNLRSPFAPAAEDRFAANRLVRASGFFSHPLVAVGPGSKMQAKRWPEERYALLGDRILERLPKARLVVVGGPEDSAVGERLCRRWGPRSLNAAGKLGIWESGALLQDCTLFVGNDTGTMHLAASVGTQCVAIFSARDHPGRWEPTGVGHSIHRKDVDCKGCMLQTCLERDLECLRAIEVEEVLESVIRRLESSRMQGEQGA